MNTNYNIQLSFNQMFFGITPALAQFPKSELLKIVEACHPTSSVKGLKDQSINQSINQSQCPELLQG